MRTGTQLRKPALLGIILTGILTSCQTRKPVEQLPWPGTLEPLVPSQEASDTKPSPHIRYRYSVVAGGIHDLDELRYATRERLVRDHYRDINLNAVRFTSLDHDRAVYVSYRVGNQIYWTRHQVHLKRGESILSDGRHQVRERCGNRLSDTPQEPVETSSVTRDLNDFDLPPIDAQPLRPPVVAEFPIDSPHRTSVTRRDPPLIAVAYPAAIEPVPEPATIFLCISGIGFLVLRSLQVRYRADRSRKKDSPQPD